MRERTPRSSVQTLWFNVSPASDDCTVKKVSTVWTNWAAAENRRSRPDPVIGSRAAESESAVHDGRTHTKEESQTKMRTNTGTHTWACMAASRGGTFRSSAPHLFTAKYNQNKLSWLLPSLCVTSWVGQRMKGGESQEGEREVSMNVTAEIRSKSRRGRAYPREIQWQTAPILTQTKHGFLTNTRTPNSTYSRW